MNYLSLGKDRLKIPKLSPNPASKIVAQNTKMGEFVIGAASKTTGISAERITNAALNVLLDGNGIDKALKNDFGGFDVRDIARVFDSGSESAKQDMQLLMNVAKEYYTTYCKYPSINEIKNNILKSAPLKGSQPSVIDNVINCLDELYATCAKTDKKKDYDNTMSALEEIIINAYKDQNASLPQDKQTKNIERQANKKTKDLHVNLLRSIKNRDGEVEDAVRRVALSFIHFANFKLLNENFKDIIQLKNAAIQAKENKDPKFDEISKQLDFVARKFTFNAQRAFFAKYSTMDSNDKESQPANTNKLKHYQAQATVNVFLDETKKTINMIYPPRAGKTRSSLCIAAHLLDYTDERDKVFFYSQSKNMDDIINQIIDSFPELVGLIKLQNYDNQNKFYNDNMISYYVDKTPIASIPNVLKDLLEKKVNAKNNDSVRNNLLNSFDTTIRSMLSAVKDKSETELAKMFKNKQNDTSNPYYALYSTMKAVAKKTSNDLFETNKQELFNAKTVAAMTLYIAKLRDDDFLSDENFDSVKDTMLQWYENVLLQVKNTADAKFVIASKYDLIKELPNENVLMSMAEKNKHANTESLQKDSVFKFNGGIYNIALKEQETTEKEPLVFSSKYDSQNDTIIQGLIQDALNNIEPTRSSSLVAYGAKKQFVIIPNHKKEKNINKTILAKIQQEFEPYGIDGKENKKGTIVPRTILKAYNDSLMSLFTKRGIEIQDAKSLANLICLNLKQDLNRHCSDMYRLLGINERNVETHKSSINDIKINGENLLCYTFKPDKELMENYNNKAIEKLQQIFSNKSEKICDDLSNIAIKNNIDELELQEQIVAAIGEINTNMAIYHNQNLFKEQYKSLFFPTIKESKKTGDKYYGIETQFETISRLDEKKEAYSLAINFAVKNDYFFHRCSLNDKNGILTFNKCNALGAKYSLETNETVLNTLQNYEASMELNRNVNKKNSHNYTFKILNTGNEIYEFASKKYNKEGSTFAISSNTLQESSKDVYSVSIIDESHKNENEQNLNGLSLLKLDANSKKIIKNSGTPPIEMPSVFSILDIKSKNANFLISLYRDFPAEFNTLSKNAVNSAINNDGKVDVKALGKGLIDIPGMPAAILKFVTNNYELDLNIDPAKFANNEQALAAEVSKALSKELEGLVYLMRDIIDGVKQEVVKSNISNSKKLLNSDIPNFLYDSKEFCEKYLGDSIDAKFNIDKICISARTLAAHYHNSQKSGTLDLVRSPKIGYNIMIEDGNRIFNKRADKYFPNLFAAIHNYSLVYKLASMRNRIDRVVDAFFDSLKNTQELENSRPDTKTILKNEKENLIADKNLSVLKDMLANSGLDLSYEDFIVSKMKTNNTSAQELTKEILKNNGNSLKLEKFNDKALITKEDMEEKELLEKKVSFIKQYVIPNIADIINNPNYIEDVEKMAFSIIEDEDRNYAYNPKSLPFIVMFDKNVIVEQEIDYNANLYINNDCVLKDKDTNKTVYFNHTISFDKDALEEYFPTLGKIIDDFEPFNDTISNSKQSFYAYSILSDNNFAKFINEQSQNGFKFPVYTDRIATNLFTNLIVLEESIKEHEKIIEDNQIPNNKLIFSLVTNPDIKKIVDAIDKDELKRKYNIDYIVINDTNEFQKNIDNLKAENRNPDILILPKKQVAEGNQIYGFTLGDENKWNRSAFADGIEASKDIKTTIQAISRVDSQELRSEYEKITGNKNFNFNIALFGYKATYKKKKGIRSNELALALENYSNGGIISGNSLIEVSRSVNDKISFEGKPNNAIVKTPFMLEAYSQQFTSGLNVGVDFAELSSNTLSNVLVKELKGDFLTLEIENQAKPLIDNVINYEEKTTEEQGVKL